MTIFSSFPNTIAEWESKTLSNEKINPPYTTNHSLSPKIVWMNNSGIRLEFEGSCLNQYKVTFTPNNAVNLFIVYKLDRWSRDLNTNFTLNDCFCESVKLTKNADPDKYEYSSYDIGFDSRLEFSLTDGSAGQNVAIFEVDMSSSVHIDSKNKDILILVKGPTQGLDNTALTAEGEYSINFSRSQRKFCLSLHYSTSNGFLFVNKNIST